MTTIGRLLLVLLAVFAGAAFVASGLVIFDGLQGGRSGAINYWFVGLLLGGLPMLLSLLWLWALQRTAYGPNRSPRTALAAGLLFLAGAGFIVFAVVTRMPLRF